MLRTVPLLLVTVAQSIVEPCTTVKLSPDRLAEHAQQQLTNGLPRSSFAVAAAAATMCAA